MTSRIAKLVAAAVLVGSLPAAALAHDLDHDREHRPVLVSPAPVYPAPAPREDWRVRAEHGRRDAWRERELAGCRADLRALDARRAHFHATHADRPWQLRRYDRRYVARRAELERRMMELTRLAWR